MQSLKGLMRASAWPEPVRKTQEVDFDTLTRKRNWFQLASTMRLRAELQRTESTRLATMAVLFHMRLTRPILPDVPVGGARA